ncbi:hypothetical protein [Streptomyces sp. NPDC127092]|uniref:hypothetical protein n=1 Tax=Streptomyces sp. NPDC127092 TaxID=3347135 RepID=UPI0036489170
MTQRRTRFTMRAAAVLGLFGLPAALLTAPAAQATTSQCAYTWIPGAVYGEVTDVTLISQGRTLKLWNDKGADLYSYAEITSGYQSGDQVWIDRSYNHMPLGDRHPSNLQVDMNGGWFQCGPFSRRYSGVVNSWHYAVRACMRPVNGISHCGRWNVDQ